MGGQGSGRRAWGATRPSTDAALALDVRRLARRGGLAPGGHTVVWPSLGGDAAVAYAVDAGGLTLAYRTRRSPVDAWQDRRQVVGQERTPCHYGGERPWFRCPGCARRVAVLFWYAGAFRCRPCHGLAYASTRQDANRRRLGTADRLRQRLEGAPGLGLVPERPAWMGRRAYWRAVDRIVALDAAYVTGVLARAGAAAERPRRKAG